MQSEGKFATLSAVARDSLDSSRILDGAMASSDFHTPAEYSNIEAKSVVSASGDDREESDAKSLQGSFIISGKSSWERGVGTFAHQEDLAPLPVPELEDTLKKFVRSVEPLLSESEFEHSKAVVEEFKQGAGKKLHAMLEERATEHKNWLEEWWEQLVYLRARYPIAVWINWHGVLPGSWGAHGAR